MVDQDEVQISNQCTRDVSCCVAVVKRDLSLPSLLPHQARRSTSVCSKKIGNPYCSVLKKLTCERCELLSYKLDSPLLTGYPSEVKHQFADEG